MLLIAAAVMLPDVLGLDQWTPFAQLVAFRPVWVAGGLVLGVAALAPRRARLIGVALIAVSLVGGVTVLPRTVTFLPGRFDGSASAAGPPAAPASPGDAASPTSTDSVDGGGETAGRLTLLSANVSGSADVSALAGLVHSRQPEVIVLAEAGASYRQRLQQALAGESYQGTSERSSASTVTAMSVLVSADLGQVSIGMARAGTTYPVLTVTAGGLGARVVAYHSAAPLPFASAGWRRDLARLARWCGDTPGNAASPTIVAGDFNATLDHSAFKSAIPECTDAASALGKGLHGTWPSQLPSWLTPQIDHVLTTPRVEPTRISYERLPETDHRAVVARINVP